MLEVLGQDFIRVARAKGLAEKWVVGRHALKNALLPVVTMLGLSFGHLLGGTVIVESIFAWPGVGKYCLESIFNRDYPVVQGYVLFMALVFVLVNLAVDVSYRMLDPRVRLTGGRQGGN
jgi:peptide/nickel transport system permease protein